MLKSLGITTLALAGLLGFAAPKKADAKVHFGVYLGGPAYVAPPPAYVPPGIDPYAYGPGYPYAYSAPAYADPYYVGPDLGFGIGFGGGHHFHAEHHEHHDFHGHRR